MAKRIAVRVIGSVLVVVTLAGLSYLTGGAL